MITSSNPDSSSAVTPAVMPKVSVTVDTKGRVRTSKEQRRLILAEFERSGVSAARFVPPKKNSTAVAGDGVD
jgi:hypothetical protein